MDNKLLIINYKTYEEATGDEAVDLTKEILDAVSELDQSIDLIICPQIADMFRLHEEFPELKLWAQNIDVVDGGKATGWVGVDSVVDAGGIGTLINHSEHSLHPAGIQEIVEISKENNITSCVAVADLETAKQISEYQPDIIAYEPPELIGTGHSLVETDSKVAGNFIDEMQDSGAILLLGAGVSSKEDVSGAIKLGYKGVLLASAIVKAENPKEKTLEILSGFAN